MILDLKGSQGLDLNGSLNIKGSLSYKQLKSFGNKTAVLVMFFSALSFFQHYQNFVIFWHYRYFISML